MELRTLNINKLEKDCGWCLNTDDKKQISKEDGNIVWCNHHNTYIKDVKDCEFYE